MDRNKTFCQVGMEVGGQRSSIPAKYNPTITSTDYYQRIQNTLVNMYRYKQILSIDLY